MYDNRRLREREIEKRDREGERERERERECYKMPILSSFNKITNVYTPIKQENS